MENLETDNAEIQDLNDLDDADDEETENKELEDEIIDEKTETDTDTALDDDASQGDKEQERTNKTAEIDKDRQQAQQDIANARRQIAALETANAAMRQKVEQKPPEPPKDEDPLDKLNRLEKENTRLKEDQAQLKGRMDNIDAERQTQYESDMVHAQLKLMDKEYGADLRNEALVFAKAKFKEMGFTLTPESMPVLEDQLLYIERGYTNAKIAKLEGGGATTTTTATTTKRQADTSKTGQQARTTKLKGSVDDVAEAMQKENPNFGNYLMEE